MKYEDVIVEKLGSPRFNRLVRDTVAEIISEATRELQVKGEIEISSRSLETRIDALRGKFKDQLDAELSKVKRKIRKASGGSPIIRFDDLTRR